MVVVVVGQKQKGGNLVSSFGERPGVVWRATPEQAVKKRGGGHAPLRARVGVNPAVGAAAAARQAPFWRAGCWMCVLQKESLRARGAPQKDKTERRMARSANMVVEGAVALLVEKRIVGSEVLFCSELSGPRQVAIEMVDRKSVV